MLVLSKSRLREALTRLAEDFELYVPGQKGDISGFFLWTKEKPIELALDIVNPFFSPKSVVLPQTEKMHSFITDKQGLKIKEVFESDQDRVIFGIRTCDLRAISSLDKVFLTRGYAVVFMRPVGLSQPDRSSLLYRQILLCGP